MSSVVKLLLKGEVGGHVLSSHGNYIVDHGKSWKNHGIVFLNCCGNPVIIYEQANDIEIKTKNIQSSGVMLYLV